MSSRLAGTAGEAFSRPPRRRHGWGGQRRGRSERVSEAAPQTNPSCASFTCPFSHWIICWLLTSSAWLSSSFFFWSPRRREKRASLRTRRVRLANSLRLLAHRLVDRALAFAQQRLLLRDDRRLEFRQALARAPPEAAARSRVPLADLSGARRDAILRADEGARASSRARGERDGERFSAFSSRPLSTFSNSSLSFSCDSSHSTRGEAVRAQRNRPLVQTLSQIRRLPWDLSSSARCHELSLRGVEFLEETSEYLLSSSVLQAAQGGGGGGGELPPRSSQRRVAAHASLRRAALSLHAVRQAYPAPRRGSSEEESSSRSVCAQLPWLLRVLARAATTLGGDLQLAARRRRVAPLTCRGEQRPIIALAS